MPMYPKMLPWLAKRAEIPVELAEKLWRRAVGDAAELAGNADSAEFHQFAIERFLDLVDGESSLVQAVETRGSSWFWRHHRRLVAMTFRAANQTTLYWQRTIRDARRPLMLG